MCLKIYFIVLFDETLSFTVNLLTYISFILIFVAFHHNYNDYESLAININNAFFILISVAFYYNYSDRHSTTMVSLVSLFNSISTFVGYLMPKPSL